MLGGGKIIECVNPERRPPPTPLGQSLSSKSFGGDTTCVNPERLETVPIPRTIKIEDDDDHDDNNNDDNDDEDSA